ncbi:Probable transposable element [Penicillium roqueforti FM164]|uniref:Str. FM013 n=2 Tax=Penicillium TaxID=5073 RepID=A0A0G4P9M1_PENC3|nr:Probable transposable element [Penicillium roqueforti FM164]CRL23011.1 unnamed protein product [Penicillium camemberti]
MLWSLQPLHDSLRDKTHLRYLCTVQRAALIRVLSSFRTVETITLDVEAHVLPNTCVCATAHKTPSLDFIPYPRLKAGFEMMLNSTQAMDPPRRSYE